MGLGDPDVDDWLADNRVALDAFVEARLDSAPQLNTGDERDEYPSGVGREIRWLVETGATAAGNGPGSLRTQRRAGRDRPATRPK